MMYHAKENLGNQTHLNNANDSRHHHHIVPTLSTAAYYDETDSSYSHELARRSVARAALNLGIDSMSGDALDGLGDVLISYLERLGQSMATITEASNRSSAHCNILDAIHAIEMNMAPSRVGGGGGRANAPMNAWEDLATFAFGSQWKDKLVDFNTDRILSKKILFKEKEKQKLDVHNAAVATAALNMNNGNQLQPKSNDMSGLNGQQPNMPGHKKNGDKLKNLTQNNPHLTNNNNHNNNAVKTTDNKSKQGEPEDDGAWNAPYLDVVPIYPLLRETSRLNTSIKIGNMLLATEDEACRGENDGLPNPTLSRTVSEKVDKAEKKAAYDMNQIPFQNFFGSITNSATSQHDDNDNSAGVTSNKKRARFEENNQNDVEPNAKRHKSSVTENNNIISSMKPNIPTKTYRPAYMPSFLPPFPPKHTYQPTTSSNNISETNDQILANQSTSFSKTKFDGDPSIRRSLVSQQQQQQKHGVDNNDDIIEEKNLSLTVPSGSLSTRDPHSLAPLHGDQQKQKESARSGGVGISITPLEKISVSRVSKILEGSMDLSHCG